MDAATSWLPVGAANVPAVGATLAAAFETWSARWLGPSSLVLASVEPVENGHYPGAIEGGWVAYGRTVAIATSRPEMRRIAGAALQASIESLVLSEADADIVDGFTDRMIADLSAEVERAFGLAADDASAPRRVLDPFGRRGGIVAAAAIGCGETLLRLALPVGLWAGAVRKSLAPARAQADPLPPLSDALSATPVRVEAVLGRAVLPFGEVVALAPGDLLVLDTSVAAGAELRLASSTRLLARASLAAAGDRLALALQPAGCPKKETQDGKAPA
ncbi:MAG TPA: FliM/FliN family flagellar motor C-terminal domain-containing protein [Allosphingosinicella sp.]|jgi:flagellar motor switch/type III secretory pathway protein FliN